MGKKNSKKKLLDKKNTKGRAPVRFSTKERRSKSIEEFKGVVSLTRDGIGFVNLGMQSEYGYSYTVLAFGC